MKPLFKHYFSTYRFEYNLLITDYDKSIDISRKKTETHDKLTKLINDRYLKLQYESNRLRFDEIKNILGGNKNENFDSAVMQLTNSDSKKLRNEKIKNLSILQAYRRFTYYLSDISVKHQITLPETQSEFNKEIDKNNKVQNEFTTARQVLCVYYILMSLDIEMQFINKTDIAKLVHLFSGTSIPIDENGHEEIDNSLIYKKVKKIFKKGDKKTVQDSEFILKYFEKIDTSGSTGIKKIIKLIRGDIDSYKQM